MHLRVFVAAISSMLACAPAVVYATSTFRVDTARDAGPTRREVFGANVEFIGADTGTMQSVLSGTPLIRFPGGDDTSTFVWSDPTTGACSMPRWNWDAVAEYARANGAALLIESNVVRCDAASTAAWVSDARARGITVPYLDVGNEVWGSWDAGYRTPLQYAQDVHATAVAVRAVSPETRIVLEIGTFNEESWNREAIRLTADVIDAVDYHYYPNHLSSPEALSVAAGADGIAPLVARIRAMIRAEAPSRADAIEVLIGEYDGASDPPRGGSPTPGHAYAQWSMPNALFYGVALGEMQEQGVSAATFYELQGYRFGAVGGSACTSFDPGVRRPKELALRLWREHVGSRRLEVQSSDVPTFSSAGPTNWDGFAGTAPYVRAYGSRNDANSTLTLVVVNRHPTDALQTEWTLAGFEPSAHARTWQLAGNSMWATNENVGGAPDAVHIVEGTADIAGASFAFEAPAHSITVIEIPRAAPVAAPDAGVQDAATAGVDASVNVGSDAAPQTDAAREPGQSSATQDVPPSANCDCRAGPGLRRSSHAPIVAIAMALLVAAASRVARKRTARGRH